jgi:lipopolysaccharide biosynthesis glycosyltransferase
MEKDCIHIALAFDQNFITPFYVLLTSIFSNNDKNNLVFHTIAEGLDQKQKDDILSFVHQNNAEIFFYSIDIKLVQRFTLAAESPHITSATYYRLYFPELISIDIDYLLYLDTDIIVIGELGKLYQTAIGNFPVGAVADIKVGSRPDIGVENDGEYFNAGVLLINLKRWRLLRVTERAVKFLIAFPEKIILADQDALNNVFANNWYKLDKCYNITFYDVPKHLRKKEFEYYLKDKVIIHYTTQNKPWLLTCTNRLRYLYYYYLQRSPYKGLNVYADERFRNQYQYKLIKRRLKELLIDIGIPV